MVEPCHYKTWFLDKVSTSCATTRSAVCNINWSKTFTELVVTSIGARFLRTCRMATWHELSSVHFYTPTVFWTWQALNSQVLTFFLCYYVFEDPASISTKYVLEGYQEILVIARPFTYTIAIRSSVYSSTFMQSTIKLSSYTVTQHWPTLYLSVSLLFSLVTVSFLWSNAKCAKSLYFNMLLR